MKLKPKARPTACYAVISTYSDGRQEVLLVPDDPKQRDLALGGFESQVEAFTSDPDLIGDLVSVRFTIGTYYQSVFSERHRSEARLSPYFREFLADGLKG